MKADALSIVEVDPSSKDFQAVWPSWHLSQNQLNWKLTASPYGPTWILIARCGDDVAAILAIGRTRTHWADRVWESGFIYHTFTVPEFRRRGLMSALLEYAATHGIARGFQLIFALPNPQARQVYSTAHFAEVGFLRGWVGPTLRSAGPALMAAKNDVGYDSQPGDNFIELASLPDLQTLPNQQTPSSDCVHSVRTSDFLRWRFGGWPQSRYRVVETDKCQFYCRTGSRGHLAELQILGASSTHAGDVIAGLKSARRGYRGLVSFSVSDGPWYKRLLAAGFIPTMKGSPIHVIRLDPALPAEATGGLYLDGLDVHTW